MEAAVLQPRHSIKKLAIVMLAVHSSHGGGHEQTTDEISKLFGGLALSSEFIQEKRPWGEMKEQKGEDGVEMMTGEEGKEKKEKTDVENYSGSDLMDGHVVEEVRGSWKSCTR